MDESVRRAETRNSSLRRIPSFKQRLLDTCSYQVLILTMPRVTSRPAQTVSASQYLASTRFT